MSRYGRAYTETEYLQRDDDDDDDDDDGNGGSRWLKLRGGVLRSPFLSLRSFPSHPTLPRSPPSFTPLNKRPGFLSRAPPLDNSPTRQARELPPSTSTVRHQCDTGIEPCETVEPVAGAPRAEGEENAMEDERDEMRSGRDGATGRRSTVERKRRGASSQ